MVWDVHRRPELARTNYSPELDVSFIEQPDLDLLQRFWSDLEPRSEASYFQTWGWIGSWLRELPVERRPSAVVIRNKLDMVVGLGLLGRHRNLRHGVLPTRGLYLSETGDGDLDVLTPEYNGLLAERGALFEVADACLAFLVEHTSGWEELFLHGTDAAQCKAFEAASLGRLTHRVLYEKSCPFVDLEAVRARGGNYLENISRNTRYQIRRAVRLYEKGNEGTVTIESASSPKEALLFLDGLKELHQAYWKERGRPGSFANPFFERFHRRLIRDRFDASEIQLARVSGPGAVIGYLYNFVHRGCVYAYQSGFRYDSDGRHKPGLVSHYLAIDHHLRTDARIYDFMAGEGQHKRSLATDTRLLSWSRAHRNLLKFRVENSLRRWKNQTLFRRRIQESANN